MLVKVYRSITPEYDGWTVTYPKAIDDVMTFLWKHGICQDLISRIIGYHVHRAKRTGKYTYCEVLELEEF